MLAAIPSRPPVEKTKPRSRVGTTDTVRRRPSESTSSFTGCESRAASSARRKRDTRAVTPSDVPASAADTRRSMPSTLTTRSPSLRPALSAAPPLDTLTISNPAVSRDEPRCANDTPSTRRAVVMARKVLASGDSLSTTRRVPLRPSSSTTMVTVSPGVFRPSTRRRRCSGSDSPA